MKPCLKQAKESYESLVYPGRLAEDVELRGAVRQTRRDRHRRLRWIMGVAALFLLAMWLGSDPAPRMGGGYSEISKTHLRNRFKRFHYKLTLSFPHENLHRKSALAQIRRRSLSIGKIVPRASSKTLRGIKFSRFSHRKDRSS